MAIQNGLYHRDVFFPKEFGDLFGRTYCMRLTKHAQNACVSDRYGLITPPKSFTIQAGQIIEIEIVGGQCSKVVIRQAYDATRDIIIVFIPEGTTAVCKTFWINLKTDVHKTLDRTRYIQPLTKK